MKKIILTIGLFLPLFMYSCKNTPKEAKEEVATENVEEVEATVDEEAQPTVVTASYTDEAGKTLNVVFDVEKEEATINFDGVEAVLAQQVSASGIRYSNSEFELVEWQGETTLRQNDEVVFTHKEVAAEEEVTAVAE